MHLGVENMKGNINRRKSFQLKEEKVCKQNKVI